MNILKHFDFLIDSTLDYHYYILRSNLCEYDLSHTKKFYFLILRKGVCSRNSVKCNLHQNNCLAKH